MISVREFVEDLKRHGYSVKFNAKIKGRSGQVHHVDGLAKDGRKAIVWVEKRGHTTNEIIETFVIAYDTGAEACYVVDKGLGEEDRKLVEFYKMKLLKNV